MNQNTLFNKLKKLKDIDKCQVYKNEDEINIFLSDKYFDFECILNLIDDNGEYSIR